MALLSQRPAEVSVGEVVVVKFKIGRWRIAFGLLPTTRVVGIYSLLRDMNHILMWDFDDINLKEVTKQLSDTQRRFKLPNIYIFNTGKKNHFVAWCFKRCSLRQAAHIISSCKDIDWEFFRLGVYRNKWTLRISEKCGRKMKLVRVLKSNIKEDVNPRELVNWVLYETVVDGYKNKIYEFNIPKEY